VATARAAQAGDGVAQAAAKAELLKAYLGLFTIAGDTLTWNDGTKMVWDDGRQRTPAQLNNCPDVEDMFHYIYPKVSAGPLKKQQPDGSFAVARSDIYGGSIVKFVPFTKLVNGAVEGTHSG
jgi:hypothetical protein